MVIPWAWGIACERGRSCGGWRDRRGRGGRGRAARPRGRGGGARGARGRGPAAGARGGAGAGAHRRPEGPALAGPAPGNARAGEVGDDGEESTLVEAGVERTE